VPDCGESQVACRAQGALPQGDRLTEGRLSLSAIDDLRRNQGRATQLEKSLWEGTLCPTAVRHRWPVAHRVRSPKRAVHAGAIHHRPSLSRFAFITCFAIAPN
jgi:hypothetical protein